MIEEVSRNCRNCAHCNIDIVRDPRFDKCLRNGGEYCDTVIEYRRNSCSANNLVHWAPRPPTLWENFKCSICGLLRAIVYGA